MEEEEGGRENRELQKVIGLFLDCESFSTIIVKLPTKIIAYPWHSFVCLCSFQHKWVKKKKSFIIGKLQLS